MFEPLSRRQCLGGIAAFAGAGLCGHTLAFAAAPVAPRLNQLGYLPAAPKRFSFATGSSGPMSFTVESTNGEAVLTGSLDRRVYDMTAAAGELVRCGDFSSLRRPGRYRLRVGGQLSHGLTIGESVYATLLRDALRSFHLIRANAALDDPVTGIAHKAAHHQDKSLDVGGARRDLSGGWYNAGDYGKWTHMAAISASEMMWLHELRPERAATLVADVPQTHAGMPDLVQEARWGLEWLLRMQNGDGSVVHKVDTEPDFAWGRLPEDDPYRRRARGAASVDAGVFVGAILQGARLFAALDPGFAARCSAAATRSWTWLEANRNVLHDDPYYRDADPGQEHLWALTAMAASTRDEALLKRAADAVSATAIMPFRWSSPHALGVMTLARHGDPAGRAAATAAIIAAAADVSRTSSADPYGFSARPEDYSWGSIENALNGANICLFAHELTGVEAQRHAAQSILDYVLGNNALDLSFVTGHGTRRVERPYHWSYRTQKRIMPGWPSGGPNGGGNGGDRLLAALVARGTRPAKCFVDACQDDGSWASNEGQTTTAAALLLAVGLYSL